MNFGTKIRTILAIATSLNTALMATDLTGFHNPAVDMTYKIVSIVLNFVIVACVTYFNNDYTEIASEKTAEMRQAKLERSIGYEGEHFFDVDEPDENEEEDVDDAE